MKLRAFGLLTPLGKLAFCGPQDLWAFLGVRSLGRDFHRGALGRAVCSLCSFLLVVSVGSTLVDVFLGSSET